MNPGHSKRIRQARRQTRTDAYAKSRARGANRVGAWIYAYVSSRPLYWPYPRLLARPTLKDDDA